jgi:hypothetical protein
LTPISSLENDWVWVERPADRRQWKKLLAHARSAWGYEGVPHACWGGGPVFPRECLERLASIDIPRLSTEEIRIPLFAQIFGFSMIDTDLRRDWHDPDEDRFFNLQSAEIEPSVIMAELAKPDGRRAFHPVRTSSSDSTSLHGSSSLSCYHRWRSDFEGVFAVGLPPRRSPCVKAISLEELVLTGENRRD